MTGKIRILIVSVIIGIIVVSAALSFGDFGVSNKEESTTAVEVLENSTGDKKESTENTTRKQAAEETTQPIDETTKTVSETTIETTTIPENTTEETTTIPVTTTEETTTILAATTVQENTTAYIPNAVQNSTIDPNKPMVALTFDDGPSGANTPRLLDCLEQYGAHATFFVVGENIGGHEDIIQRAYSIGCEIGNHSTTHAKLTTLSNEGISNEIQPVVATIRSLTGQSSVICRPPYGAVNDTVVSVINAPVILWSIDTLDWKTRNADTTVATIQQQVSDGDIILLHDIHQQSVDAAIRIIPWLIDNGYQLVTVSELGYYKQGGLTVKRYGSIR